ncbi:MAG: hypothetical protein HY002_10470 [Candidatus Rokubacteria bacterium]|nr:hypothetical protein [Candidatus Rokubacteria bacterium]
MTNTLHRYGDVESLRDDYVIFAMPAKGLSDAECTAPLRRFLELALRRDPVNIGDAKRGGAYRGRPTVNPLNHWFPQSAPDFKAVIDGIDGYTVAAAVFDSPVKLEAFLQDVKAADLGMCVNVSAVTDAAQAVLGRVGITRHSVEYSLPFRFGRTDLLPDRRTLELYTMCGHGMVSANLARKMRDWVREGRRTPEEAARYLGKFCSCGVFNIARAARLLEEGRGTH